MDLHFDMVHPRQRDEMMLAASVRIGLGQFDPIAAFQVIHGSHVHAVGTDDFHLFLDHHRCNHAILLDWNTTFGAGSRSGLCSARTWALPLLLTGNGQVSM